MAREGKHLRRLQADTPDVLSGMANKVVATPSAAFVGCVVALGAIATAVVINSGDTASTNTMASTLARCQ